MKTLKKIITAILLIHIFLEMVVVLFNSKFNLSGKSLVLLSVMSIFMILILLSIRYNRIKPFVITGCVFYLILNCIVFLFLLISSQGNTNISILLGFFLPGILSSLILPAILWRQSAHDSIKSNITD